MLNSRIYFCVLEAVQNSTKHAPQAAVRVQLRLEPDQVRFEVIDNGSGFDPRLVHLGMGVQSMRDRLAALGGTLLVHSAPGRGTTVSGCLVLNGDS
jgi:signal transduction histidine kinase